MLQMLHVDVVLFCDHRFLARTQFALRSTFVIRFNNVIYETKFNNLWYITKQHMITDSYSTRVNLLESVLMKYQQFHAMRHGHWQFRTNLSKTSQHSNEIKIKYRA